MRIFGKVNGRIDRYDRAEMLTPPFDLTTLTKFLRLSPIMVSLLAQPILVLDVSDARTLQLKVWDEPTLGLDLVPRGG